MTRPAVVVALWAALVGVSWTVVHDRQVLLAARQFTREQVLRHQQGVPVTTIHQGFSPQLSGAAWSATAAVTPLVIAGGAAGYFTRRRRT